MDRRTAISTGKLIIAPVVTRAHRGNTKAKSLYNINPNLNPGLPIGVVEGLELERVWDLVVKKNCYYYYVVQAI